MLASLILGPDRGLGHKGPPGFCFWGAGQDPGTMTAAWGQESGATGVALVLVWGWCWVPQ